MTVDSSATVAGLESTTWDWHNRDSVTLLNCEHELAGWTLRHGKEHLQSVDETFVARYGLPFQLFRHILHGPDGVS